MGGMRYYKNFLWNTVIPAKAGIQVLNYFFNVRFPNWIPACVGMTIWILASVAQAAPISGPVSVLVRQDNGMIFVGGHFSEESSLVRLNVNGDIDPGFMPVLKNSTVSALVLRPDGDRKSVV